MADLDRARLQQRRQDAVGASHLHELNVGNVLEAPEPAIDWLLDGYAERGSIIKCHGAGGVGKSLFALALCQAVTGGYPFLGHETAIGRAVIIDGENGTSEVRRRLHRCGFQASEARIRDGDLRYFQADAPFIDTSIPRGQQASKDLLCALVGERTDLLVIDSQRACWSGDENEAVAVRALYTVLRQVVNETGAAILVLHHDNKSGGYSGSTDLNASVDTRWHLTRSDDGLITLEHAKLRCAPEQPPLAYRMHLEGGVYAFTLQHARTPRGDVFDALTGEWQTATEMAKAAGVRRDQVEQLLTQLTRSGDAEQAVGPQGRSARATCWRLPVPTWDKSGQVPAGEPVTDLSPDLHTPVGGGVGTSQGREPVPAPDRWHDPVDSDLGGNHEI